MEVHPTSRSSRDWLKSEDGLLVNLVDKYGPKNWIGHSKTLNEAIHGGEHIRNSKQCRGRWINHLDPELKREKWTTFEDDQLLSLRKQVGNKWSYISKNLPGRNENSVKNRWKSLNKRKDSVLEESTGDLIDCDTNPSTENHLNIEIEGSSLFPG